MKYIFTLVLLGLLACNEPSDYSETRKIIDVETLVVPDSALAIPDTVAGADTVPATGTAPSKTYANKRFRNVTVVPAGKNTFEIKGQGQIFEASFGWVIEDGHNELQSGFATTDAGAPEWGNFNFTVKAEKAEANSTLHLILFETSAKDGSRQHELPLLLY